MPSASDLNRYHSDSENFIRQLDDLLGASKAAGQAKPRLDPKAAQNRIQDLAKQIQGAAITNPDSEEVKILNELTQGLADERSFAKSIGSVRKKFDDFKKKRDDLFRESLEVQTEIEDRINTENKEIERARKTLEETDKKANDIGKKDDAALKGYNDLNSGLKKSIERRTAKIKELQEKLGERGLKLEDAKKIRDELNKALASAKTEIDKFQTESKEALKKATKVKTDQETKGEAEQAAKAEEEEAPQKDGKEEPERPAEAAEDKEKTEASTTRSAEPATKVSEQANDVDAKVKELMDKGGEVRVQRSDGSWSAGQIVNQQGDSVQVSVTNADGSRGYKTVQASALVGWQATPSAGQVTAEIQATAPAAAAAQSVQAEVRATAQAQPTQTGTQVTVQATADKLERAAQSRGISVTAEATVAPGVAATAGGGTVTVMATVTALASGAAQAAQWLTSHENLAPEQMMAQARQEIGARSARETESSFTTVQEATQARAENRGFANALVGSLQQRAIQTGDARWEQAANSVQSHADATAKQSAQRIEIPGVPASAVPSIAEIDRQWASMGVGGQATPTTAATPSTGVPKLAPIEATRAEALMAQRAAEASPERALAGPEPSPLAYRGPAPRPHPRLAPGTSIKPRAAMPLTASGTPASGGPAREGIGGDTELTDQSISMAGEQLRPSVLDLGSPQSKGTYAQGEHVSGPMAGDEELELARTLGGGEFVAGADVESQKAKERAGVSALQSFMGGAAMAGLGPVAAQETTSETAEEDEEDWGDWDQMDQQFGGEQEGGGPLAKGRQMLEDKISEKVQEQVEKRVKQELEKRFGQKAGQKAAEKAAEKVAEKAAQQVATKGTSVTARTTLEGAEAANTPDTLGITLAIMIVQMNVQMILKYLLKGAETVTGTTAEEFYSEASEGLGKTAGCVNSFLQQTLIEDFITLFLDCSLYCTANPGCWLVLFIIMLIFVIFAGTDSDVQGMFKLWAGV